MLGSLGSVSAQVVSGAGVAFWLPALAAVYLGATAFQPGRFNVAGAVVAIIAVRLTRSLFSLANITEAWPENVVNITGHGTFSGSRELTEISAEAQRLGVPFVVGITEDAGDNSFTNAQVVVQPDGSVTDRYDKKRRVPFGEYMPMRSWLRALGAPVDLVPRDAVPGHSPGYEIGRAHV